MEALLIAAATVLFCGLVAVVLVKLAPRADTTTEAEPQVRLEPPVHQTSSAKPHEAARERYPAAASSTAPSRAPSSQSQTPLPKPKSKPPIHRADSAPATMAEPNPQRSAEAASSAPLPLAAPSTEEPRPRTVTAAEVPVSNMPRASAASDTRLGALFLCYRREDTADAAGRLNDRLTQAFGPSGVFMDIDSVPLGIDFIEHVTDEIAKCRAVIVMIGRQWLTIQDRHGRRRLDADDDLVRAEVAAALRQRVPVIPVLVQDAEMPQADDLPDNIRLLTRRNGIDLSGAAWRAGVERLIKELDRVMKTD